MRPPEPPWGLIADDVSGACDSAVAFALHGFRTVLPLDEDFAPAGRYDLIALSTNTRKSGPEEAAAAVRSACERLEAWAAPLLYKKIDSVLRGPLEAEVAAAREAGGFRRAVVAPALPAQGRVVRGGRLLVRDPDSGAFEPSETPLPAGVGIETPDAETEADLRRIARQALEGGALPVGSGGLAFELAGLLAEASGKAYANPQPPGDPRPALLLVGSHHPVTQTQIDWLLKQGTAARVEAGVWDRDDESAIDEAGAALAAGRYGGLFLSGGDTARNILRRFGARAIELRGEVERGIPWGVVAGGVADGLTVVTKSGGFGRPETLAEVVARLRP